MPNADNNLVLMLEKVVWFWSHHQYKAGESPGDCSEEKK